MVNHLRTGLLNLGCDGYGPEFPGEEFIESGFVPRRLTHNLEIARSHLFGPRPDRLFCNYRVFQLLTMIHNSDVASFVTWYDDRLTYLPLDGSSLRQAFVRKVSQVGGTPNKLDILGAVDLNTASGKAQRAWHVQCTAVDQAVIQSYHPFPGNVDVSLQNVGGHITPINLPNSDLSATFAVPDADNLPVLHITANVLPDELGVAMQRLVSVLSETTITALFSGNEPFATLGTVWAEHREVACRWSALLLALGFRNLFCPAELSQV